MGISLSTILAAGFRSWRAAPSGVRSPEGDAHPAPAPPKLPLATFNGTVVRHGERFALREANGVLYALDSVGRAWSFEGEEVWVKGTLNTEAGLLHIEEIEAQAA